ncbi:hypothetical protein THII_0954 [Thioploca ingrica]|uniref:DUF29 domain-containing protein n=1 Tax=Thioploca ingrica TaxID=40754 RepID=A0A090BUK2_9GAMM|nr:hypothetical protein THII_0954 [Thioploca ingrica]
MKIMYDQDFHAWTVENAKLLRAGHFAEIDVLHIAEELESMGARERREVNVGCVVNAPLTKKGFWCVTTHPTWLH